MATDTSTARCRVVLGPAAHVLRRRVGASAWMVLEEMLEHSQASSDEDGHRVAVVSVRSLAASLGVAKDTVQRATTRLRELGVIEPHQARTVAGNFAIGGYRLDIPVACLSIVDTAAADASASAPSGIARRRSPRSSSVSDQLSLLLET